MPSAPGTNQPILSNHPDPVVIPRNDIKLSDQSLPVRVVRSRPLSEEEMKEALEQAATTGDIQALEELVQQGGSIYQEYEGSCIKYSRYAIGHPIHFAIEENNLQAVQ